jgi:hypothetical protein
LLRHRNPVADKAYEERAGYCGTGIFSAIFAILDREFSGAAPTQRKL